MEIYEISQAFKIRTLIQKVCYIKQQSLPSSCNQLFKNATHAASLCTKTQNAQVSTWGTLLVSYHQEMLSALAKETEDKRKDQIGISQQPCFTESNSDLDIMSI